MKILTNYDFSKNQILNVGLQLLGAHPGSPVSGQIYFNTVDKRAYIYNGTKWQGSDALDAVLTASEIVQTINSSTETILDLRLSAAAQAAIAKAHDVQTIATIPGLQAALDGKVANGRVLSDVPTGAKFTDTTYTNGAGLNLSEGAFSVAFGTSLNTVPHGNDARLSDTRVPKAHIHGKISDDGKIGTTAGLMIKTGVGGELNVMAAGTAGQFLSYNGTWVTPPNDNAVYTNGAGLALTGSTLSVIFGTAVNTVPHGNDARFSDARTPKSHTHGRMSNEGRIGTVPDLIVKTGISGELDVLPAGNAGQFLAHNGTWTTPPNQTYPTFGASVNGLVPMPGASTTSFLRSDGTWVSKTEMDYTLPTATASILGGIKSSASVAVSASTGVATVVDNSHKHTTANVTGLDTTLGTLATKDQAQAYANTVKGQAETYTREQIAVLVGTAPTTLDTLHEIAVALGNDPNFATTMTNLIGSKTGKITQVLGASVTQIITHNFSTRDVAVTIRETAAPYAQVITDIEFTTLDTLTVGFAKAPANGEYTITIIG